MNATNLYMSTCRLVMQADSDNKESLGELHKLLPYLRQSLSCTVCGGILSNPYTPTETSCQHHVCKICIGGKKRLKPSCSWCKNYETYIENSQMQLIIKCYKKLCSYVKTSCLYNKLSNLITNGSSCSLGLTDIIDEALTEVTPCNYLDPLTSPSTNKPSEKLHRPTDENTLAFESNVVNLETGLQRFVSDSSDSHSDQSELDEGVVDLSGDIKQYDKSETLLISDIPTYTNDSSNHSEDINCKLEDDEMDFKQELVDSSDHELHRPSQTLINRLNLCKSISPLLPVDSSDIIPLLDSNCNDSFESTSSPLSSSSEIYEDPIFLATEADINLSGDPEQVVLENLPLSNFSVAVTSTTLTTAVSSSVEEIDYKFNNPVCQGNNSVPFYQINNALPSTSTMSKCTTKVLNVISTSVPISSTIGVSVSSNINYNDRYGIPYSLPTSLLNNVSGSVSQTTLNSENTKLSRSANSYSQSDTIINSVSVTPSHELSDLSNATSAAITCVLNIPPGTILSNANIKQGVCDSVLKHGSQLSNGSSIYSVMYNDCDSTKITIKRKPSDIENVKKFTSLSEKLNHTGIIPSHEVIKKAKPKPKPKPKRKGCRCGNATPTPGKLTCCGQRCPCYVEAKACIECQCRGCRNPHRPGGKKVRPIIPQLGNIQIHQLHPIHSRITNMASSMLCRPSSVHPAHIGTKSTQTPIMANSGSGSQTIRAVHAMHAVQAVHGISQMHALPGNVQQLINLESAMMEPAMHPSMNVHSNIALKPVNLALSSIPAQLLINDDKSTSNSASDNSDVEIDI